jgi:hypothetical protein
MLAPLIGIAVQVSAGATLPSATCADPTPYLYLPRGGNSPGNHLSAADVAAIGARKAAADARNPAALADLQRARALSADPTQKMRALKAMSHLPAVTSNLSMDEACGPTGAQRGSLLNRFQNAVGTAAEAHASVNTGYGWAYINGLNQQGQICTPYCQSDPNHVNYYCGPATVSESGTTEGSPVAQGTAATYMHTDQNLQTSVSDFIAGMQHFVGVPTYGWSWFVWVGVAYNPTSSDYSNFWSNLEADISTNDGSVVGGDAWETHNGPHLTGHPNLLKDIFHLFQIGGWNTNYSQVYYADSATSVWSGVPAYSWYDQHTMVVILGGRGYVW